jgi:hypothetical protein
MPDSNAAWLTPLRHFNILKKFPENIPHSPGGVIKQVP